MNRVVHFEIFVDNPARATKFYTDVFGWKFEQWGEQQYWMVMTAEKDSKEMGISGGMLPREGSAPAEGQGANAFVCTVLVQNIDEMIGKVLAAGGTLAKAKYALPGMAWIAYYKDTEGNTFGIFQEDKTAK